MTHNQQPLSHIAFTRHTFTMEVLSPLRLPLFMGSAFRGGFGLAFRRAVCVQRRVACRECLLKAQCVYSQVFETPVPADAELMRTYPAAPHPFVIEPPETGQREYLPGDHLSFTLVLMGKYVEVLPYFIYAFEQLGKMGFGSKIRGKRGRFRLVEVACYSRAEYAGATAKTVVYSGADTTLAKPCRPWTWQDLPGMDQEGQLDIRFHTPGRMKYHGHFTDRLDFHIFFRTLYRRIAHISYFHSETLLDDAKYPPLLRAAQQISTICHDLRWQDQQRWSGRQKSTMKLGGLIGRVQYEGDFGPFKPYILLGTAIHCGKGCTFGLGRYVIQTGEFHAGHREETGGKSAKQTESVPA